jgi:hypothetical protein
MNPAARRRCSRAMQCVRAVPLLLAGTAHGQGAPGPAGLCTADETTFLACQVAEPGAASGAAAGAAGAARWLNLCGRPPEALQYRFGRAGRIELQYPKEAADGVERLWFAHYMRRKTDRVEIRFMNRGTEYVLFDYQEEGSPRETGVRLTAPGGKEQEFSCSGPVASRLHDLKAVLRCDADNGLNLGRCP